MVEDEEEGPNASGGVIGWAVVANVAQATFHSSGRDDVRAGLRHFSAGTKVWILPPQWGDGWDSAIVVGRHRGSRRYVRMVLPLRHLEQFRVEAIYHPAVARELHKPWDIGRGPPAQWQSEHEAEATIARHPVTKGRLKVL